MLGRGGDAARNGASNPSGCRLSLCLNLPAAWINSAGKQGLPDQATGYATARTYLLSCRQLAGQTVALIQVGKKNDGNNVLVFVVVYWIVFSIFTSCGVEV